MKTIESTAVRCTPNSWTAFIAHVKELCQDTPNLKFSKKDYANMMQYYINGKSAETYLESRG